jgi:hypothetical protein
VKPLAEAPYANRRGAMIYTAQHNTLGLWCQEAFVVDAKVHHLHLSKM